MDHYTTLLCQYCAAICHLHSSTHTYTTLAPPPPPPPNINIYIYLYMVVPFFISDFFLIICTIGNLVVVFKLQIGLYYSCQYLYVIIMCSFYMCRVFLLVPGSRWCHIWRDFCLASCRLSGSPGSPHCGRHPFFGRLVDHLPLYCGLHPVLLLCLALYRKSLDWIFCRLECVLCIGKPLSSLYAVEVVHIIW